MQRSAPSKRGKVREHRSRALQLLRQCRSDSGFEIFCIREKQNAARREANSPGKFVAPHPNIRCSQWFFARRFGEFQGQDGASESFPGRLWNLRVSGPCPKIWPVGATHPTNRHSAKWQRIPDVAAFRCPPAVNPWRQRSEWRHNESESTIVFALSQIEDLVEKTPLTHDSKFRYSRISELARRFQKSNSADVRLVAWQLRKIIDLRINGKKR